MSDTEPVPDTTDRHNTASFDDWTFDTGLPAGDALQRMCQKAAADAVQDLVDDAWMVLGFIGAGSDEDAPGPKRLVFNVYAWDTEVTLRRSFAEMMADLAELHSYGDLSMDDDDEDVHEIIRELEAAIAMIKGRMRPRRSE